MIITQKKPMEELLAMLEGVKKAASKKSRRPAPPWCSTSSVSYRASAILTHPVYHIPAWPSNGKCSELKGIIPAVPVNYVKNRT